MLWSEVAGEGIRCGPCLLEYNPLMGLVQVRLSDPKPQGRLWAAVQGLPLTNVNNAVRVNRK